MSMAAPTPRCINISCAGMAAIGATIRKATATAIDTLLAMRIVKMSIMAA